jgi:hypothetical protein
MADPSPIGPADHRDRRLVLLGGQTVPVFTCSSSDFLVRGARAKGGFGELKSSLRQSLLRCRKNDAGKSSAAARTSQAMFLE